MLYLFSNFAFSKNVRVSKTTLSHCKLRLCFSVKIYILWVSTVCIIYVNMYRNVEDLKIYRFCFKYNGANTAVSVNKAGLYNLSSNLHILAM